MKRNLYSITAGAVLAILSMQGLSGDNDKDHVLFHVNSWNSYKVIMPYEMIKNSPDWDPLGAQPCPLSIEKAIQICKTQLENSLNAEFLVSGIGLELKYIPTSNSKGVSEMGRYCYIVSLLGSPKGSNGKPFFNLKAAVLLDGSVGKIVLDKTKPIWVTTQDPPKKMETDGR